jgi:hypothetical protein
VGRASVPAASLEMRALAPWEEPCDRCLARVEDSLFRVGSRNIELQLPREFLHREHRAPECVIAGRSLILSSRWVHRNGHRCKVVPFSGEHGVLFAATPVEAELAGLGTEEAVPTRRAFCC